jgi:polyvinyl alcohol dehydrogenase (cytochrome)
MKFTRVLAILGVTLLGLLPARYAGAQVLQAINLFEQRCSACHADASLGASAPAAAAASRAPTREALSRLRPEAILESITTGAMAANASGMTDLQKRILAEYLAARPLGAAKAGHAAAMSGRCTAPASGDPAAMPMWSGWGRDASNGRMQTASAAGLTAAQVPRLTLKWAFGFPNGSSAYGQPAVAGGRIFVGSDNGFVYALQAATGCVEWSFEATAGVRTAISFGPIAGAGGARHAVYFGDLKGQVYALNADTGGQLWSVRADPHPLVRLTGAPALVDGRLYVPLSSLEEGPGSNPRYECCTFRGGVVAYDAQNGREIWRSYTIAEAPQPTRKNSIGTQQWGPAGAAIWSSPTVDLKRRALYVATGNAYTQPAADTSDSVMAFDLDTGKRLWWRQVTPNDAFVVGCADGRDNCADVVGPDFDFGSSPILRDLPGGRTVLVLGQKSGVVWALDPDRQGAVVWEKRVARGTALGGVEWGAAADDRVGYFPVADAQFGPEVAGGIYALGLGSGEQLWSMRPPPPPGVDCAATPRACVQAQSAASTVIPGVLFSGTTNGIMRAYSTIDGKVIWEYNAVREFTTTNGVPGRGGSFNGPGPVVAGGLVIMNSGYNYLGAGAPGNVLLAFAVEEH